MYISKNENAPAIVDAFTSHSNSAVLSPVVKRDLQGLGQDGSILPVENNQGTYTVRNGKPVFLGVVSDSYQIVQFRELVEQAEAVMKGYFTPDQIDSIEIKDISGRNGAFVERRYTIKAFEEALVYGNSTARTLDVGTTVAAELRMRTGYDGQTRTSLMSGCLDLVCNNGMVSLRDVDAVSRKHTKNATTAFFKTWIEQAVPQFQARVEILKDWAQTDVTWQGIEDTINALPKVSEARAKKLLDRIAIETATRGFNAYAVVSGLTYYSSHNSAEFPVRNTGNDNVAATLAERESDVTKWLASEAFKTLIAA